MAESARSSSPSNRCRPASMGDTRAWLAGVRATVQVGKSTITFSTERDPLHVLKMGTWFNTCLSLEGGANAASTLRRRRVRRCCS